MSVRSELRPAFVGLSLSVAAAVGAHAGDANAQQVPTVYGWALDRYEPNAAGDIFFASDYPWYNSTRLFALGLTADYARNPLRLSGGTDRVIVGDMFVLHAQLAVALFDRLGLNFSLPISLVQSGEPGPSPVGSSLNAYDSPVTGDMRFGARLRIVGDAYHDPASLHVGAQVTLGLPYNARDYFVSDEDVRARFYLTGAGRIHALRWSLTAGYSYRPVTSIQGDTVAGPEIFVNAAIGVTSRDGRVTAGPEFWASYLYDGGPNQTSQRLAAEAVLGIHFLVADTLLIGAAAGPGLTSAPGVPEMRGLLRVAYAPTPPPVEPRRPPRDTDYDTVPDTEDLCPNEPVGERPDPQRRGCPAHDVDEDGIADHDDLCPTVAAGDHPDPARRGCPEQDTDGDGVFDSEDQCVTTAAGDHPDPDRAGCPDGDTDADGVLNHQDQCPTVPQGAHPDPARAGCPIPDRDNDSVPDAVDHCPDQPGAPSPDPNRNGCPGLVRIEASQIRILQQVFFATNQARILPRSNAVLQAVADALRASPEIHRVAIEGHTDNVGPAAHNTVLSQRRAESVMAWLVAHGVEASRLEAHGYGPSRPLAQNTTAAGRALNRRVEFHIVDPAPGESASAAPSASTPTESIVVPPSPSAAPSSAAPASAAPASVAPSSAPASSAPASSAPMSHGAAIVE